MINKDTIPKIEQKNIWYYEDTLYLCWAWDKELIPRGDIANSVGKSLSACRAKVEYLKKENLFEKYKMKYETGDYIGSDKLL